MRKTEPRLILGVLLIAAGGLFLLQNLGIIPEAAALFWGVAFFVGGAGFLYVLYTDRSQWWAVIPGFTLIGISGTIALSEFGFGNAAGAFMLAMIAVAFWSIFVLNREFWWAIIPAGILSSVALLVLVEPFFPDEGPVGLMFLGFGGTFLAMRYLAQTTADMRWAFIPAGIFGLMGLLFLVAAVALLEYVFPVAIILAGGYLILRAVRTES